MKQVTFRQCGLQPILGAKFSTSYTAYSVTSFVWLQKEPDQFVDRNFCHENESIV